MRTVTAHAHLAPPSWLEKGGGEPNALRLVPEAGLIPTSSGFTNLAGKAGSKVEFARANEVMNPGIQIFANFALTRIAIP